MTVITLTAEEQTRFRLWLQQESESLSTLAKQAEKIQQPALVKKLKMEAAAASLVASALLSYETVNIRGES